ncbi:MAG: type II toxin-antitoxin system VapC family toxin [Pseudonocardiaceae bacterium]
MPVVDASVVVDWVAPGAADELPAQRLLRRWIATGETVQGPRLLVAEVYNALLTGVRRRRWSAADSDTAAALMAKAPIGLPDDDREIVRAWELARQYDNWPIYDMIYVALAERLGTSLVTADQRLADRLSHLDWVLSPNDVLGA